MFTTYRTIGSHWMYFGMGICMLGMLAGRVFITSFEAWRPFMYVEWLLVITALFSYRDARRLLISPAVLPGLLLIAYLALSLAWGTQESTFDYFKWASRLLLFWLGIVLMCQANMRQLRQLANALLIIACVAAIYAAVVYFRSIDVEGMLHGGAGPRNDVIPGLLHQAILGPSAILACAASAIMIRSSQDKNVQHAIITSLVALCLLAYVLMTRSRGPLVALIGWLFILSIPHLKHWRKAIVPLAVMIGILLVAGLFAPEYIHRLIIRGASYRFVIWEHSIPVLVERPWFGHGLNAAFSLSSAQPALIEATGETIQHPHNLMLATIFYGGFIALALLLATVCIPVLWLYKNHPSSLAYTLPLTALLFLMTLTDVNHLVHASNIKAVWFIFWLPTAVLAGLAVRQSVYVPISDVA